MDPVKSGGPRRGNRQRSRTRTALLRAEQSLFARRPVESVSVDDIVDAVAKAASTMPSRTKTPSPPRA